MPQMANITVKASNGTTDVVYTSLTPAAGDGSQAVWRVNSASAINGHKPTVALASQWNGNKDGRRLRLAMTYPVVQTVSGVESIVSKVPLETTVLLPQFADSAQVKEAIYQYGNLLVSTLMRAAFEEGYAPQ